MSRKCPNSALECPGTPHVENVSKMFKKCISVFLASQAREGQHYEFDPSSGLGFQTVPLAIGNGGKWGKGREGAKTFPREGEMERSFSVYFQGWRGGRMREKGGGHPPLPFLPFPPLLGIRGRRENRGGEERKVGGKGEEGE